MALHRQSDGMEDGPRPFRFDFADYERMEAAGLFADREGRVELIEGMIVEMAPPGGDHTDVTSEIQGQFYVALRPDLYRDFKVLSQGTLRIGEHSAPEPDVFVARSRAGRKYYQASDAVLVVEVSISTLDADRTVKAPLYARAGIPELWIAEPETRSIRVYRGPRPDGRWDSEATVAEGSIRPLFAPAITILLADVFAAS